MFAIRFNLLVISLCCFGFSSFVSSQEVIKILAIGNSFSQDATESYVDDLAKADSVKLIIANMYIGGCSLETHWNNALGNLSEYSYRKINEGDFTTTASQSLLNAIKDEDWDIITFQQVSQYSGMLTSYFPYLTSLYQYVKSHATNPDVKFALHQTWAYAANSTHTGFANYNNDQTQMYQAIVQTVNDAATQVGIDIIIPAGTAIQNGRTSYVGDNFCRDGYHLNLGIGRYTAACTWYEKLLDRPVIGNTFVPLGMSNLEGEIAQHAAHNAVIMPDSVTSLEHFTLGDVIDLAYPVNIDFGNTETPRPWNNVSALLAGNSVTGLSDSQGNTTSVNINIDDSFGGINTNGPTSTSTMMNLPGEATRDSFWGNAAGVFASKSETTGGFIISGLKQDKSYNFIFFASRTGSTDNRETYFNVKGKNEQTLYVNASNNTSEVVTANEITPNDDGAVSIKIGAGSNNTNVYKFFYINSLTISPSGASSVNIPRGGMCKLYPNPFKSTINIEADHIIGDVDVFDITGKIVYRIKAINSKKSNIDIGTLNNGYYIVRIDNKSFPVIKQD